MEYKDFYKNIGIPEKQPLINEKDRVKFNRFIFKELFIPKLEYCKKHGFYLELTDKDLKFINNFVDRKLKAKSDSYDGKNRFKRENSGARIEYGLLKFFGKENCFDDSIVDSSHKRNYPDLLPLGILCDVKGSSINNVPLVFKKTRSYICNLNKYKGYKYRCSNVIGITDVKGVWLLGIASPKVLEKYVDDNLMMVCKNETKTGFYGVDYLKELPDNWNEFKKMCSELSLIL